MNKYIRLDECCQIALSSIDKKSKSNEKPIKLCNFTDVYYNWNIYSSMTDEFMEATASDKNIDIFSLKQGDVVITKDSETRDDIGMAAFVYEDLPNTVLGYHCALIRPLHSVDGSYLNAFLNSYLGRKHFENQASGSGQRYTLTKEALGSIKIPLIPIHRQKAIGALFSNIDKRIHNAKQTISELESLAKTIYDYWFLQFEFPNEDGKPYKSSGGKMVWNEELKQEIPLNWNIYEILSFCSWESASQPPKSEFIHEKKEGYVRFVQNRDYDSDDNITYIPKKSSTKLCDEYDILIDKYGDKTAGKVRYGIKGAYNVALGKITSSIPHSQEYLRSFLSTNSMFNYLHNACMASTRSSMNETVFKGIFIPIPNEELLVKFEKMMKTIINKKLQMKTENHELASLRDFLLPMLMNGQTVIND